MSEKLPSSYAGLENISLAGYAGFTVKMFTRTLTKFDGNEEMISVSLLVTILCFNQDQCNSQSIISQKLIRSFQLNSRWTPK